MQSAATQQRLTGNAAALPSSDSALSISVIVPAHNSQSTLDICLQAVDSKRPNIEIIVVDDASSDLTAEIAQHRDASLVRLSRNVGAGAARNTGALAARGDLLVFLDADVIVPTDWVESLVSYFLLHPDVSAVTAILSKAHPNADFFSQYKNLYMHGILSRCDESIDFLYGSLFAVRKAEYLRMSEERILGEDTELGARMTAAGLKIHLLKSLEVVHWKRYTLLTLIRNDFSVPFFFGRIFVRRCMWFSAIRKRRFSHTSARQIAAVLLSPLVLVAILFATQSSGGWLLFALAACLIGLLNLDLLRLYASSRGIRFATLSFLFTIIDCMVMWAGVVSGMVVEYCNGLLEPSSYA